MVATPARIGFIMEEWRRVIATTSAVETRYGNLARKSDDPIETFFDDVDDAQIVANARQALLSQERRRFRVAVVGLDEVFDLDWLDGVPVARYIDDERDADRPVLVSEIAIDLAKDTATLTLWG